MQIRFYSLTIACVLSLSNIGFVQAEQESYWSWLFSFERKKEIAPVTDKLYIEECGACHFPYQPGWLPEASWKKLLTAKALEHHFDENAELDEESRLAILKLLVENSAEKSRYKRSKKIMASLEEGETPFRISETLYIKNKHLEVIEKVIKESDKLNSLSYCDKCHQKAKDADFDDDTVHIPGFPDFDYN